MKQLDIFAPPSSIDEAFWKFHKQNPGVLWKIISMTEAARLAGRRRIGMKMLFEVIRWDHLVQTQSSDFALNNNFSSRYVRLLADMRPDLADMFETRMIRS